MIERKINERQVLVIGKSNVDEDLGEIGKDITLVIKGNILKIEEEDDQEGGKNRLFKVKQITAERFEKYERPEKQVQ